MANLLISSHFHDCLQYYQAVRKLISLVFEGVETTLSIFLRILFEFSIKVL